MRRTVACILLCASVVIAQTVDWKQGDPNPPEAFAAPSPYMVNPMGSADAMVFTAPSYIKELNFNFELYTANGHNAFAWQNFKLAWSNWVLNGYKLPAPPHPIYQRLNNDEFDRYWAALTNNGAGFNANATPAQFNLPSGCPIRFDATDLRIVAPAPPARPTVLVGAATGSGYFACLPGDASPDGAGYEDSRGAFLKHLIATPFGNACYWTAR